SLWDIDEGNNAEAAREMMDSGNWVIPTFNYKLRVDKPALLYWLQIAAYESFGVNEFAARLPSALAALISILLTYELGRRMFDAATGLLAAVILASSVAFCGAAHFANPDALLNACTILTFLIFWSSYARGGRAWLILGGISTGLAMLAKGPVGLVLPMAATGLFLLWEKKLKVLLDRRLLLGVVVFGLVAFPLYIWVGVDTKAEFLRGFFLKHNVDRFTSPMENHHGPIYYYAVVLIAGFLPWSVFLGVGLWYGSRQPGRDDVDVPLKGTGLPPAYRLLWCW